MRATKKRFVKKNMERKTADRIWNGTQRTELPNVVDLRKMVVNYVLILGLWKKQNSEVVKTQGSINTST